MPYDNGKGRRRVFVTVTEHERKAPEHYGCQCGACSGWHDASHVEPEDVKDCTLCGLLVLDGFALHTRCM